MRKRLPDTATPPEIFQTRLRLFNFSNIAVNAKKNGLGCIFYFRKINSTYEFMFINWRAHIHSFKALSLFVALKNYYSLDTAVRPNKTGPKFLN